MRWATDSSKTQVYLDKLNSHVSRAQSMYHTKCPTLLNEDLGRRHSYRLAVRDSIPVLAAKRQVSRNVPG